MWLLNKPRYALMLCIVGVVAGCTQSETTVHINVQDLQAPTNVQVEQQEVANNATNTINVKVTWDYNGTATDFVVLYGKNTIPKFGTDQGNSVITQQTDDAQSRSMLFALNASEPIVHYFAVVARNDSIPAVSPQSASRPFLLNNQPPALQHHPSYTGSVIMTMPDLVAQNAYYAIYATDSVFTENTPPSIFATTSSSSYTLYGLAPTPTVQYVAYALITTDGSTFSKIGTDTAPIYAPDNIQLAISQDDPFDIDVSWSGLDTNIGDEILYSIYFLSAAQGNDPFTATNPATISSAATTLAYSYEVPAPGTYTVGIEASYKGATSRSATKDSMVTIPAPENMTITHIGTDSIGIEWDTISRVDGYVVYFSAQTFSATQTEDATPLSLEVPSGSTQATTLVGLTPNTTYYITVAGKSFSVIGEAATVQEVRLVPYITNMFVSTSIVTDPSSPTANASVWTPSIDIADSYSLYHGVSSNTLTEVATQASVPITINATTNSIHAFQLTANNESGSATTSVYTTVMNNKAKSFALGNGYACAYDGMELFCWGNVHNNSATITGATPTTYTTPIKQIAMNANGACMLTQVGGFIECWTTTPHTTSRITLADGTTEASGFVSLAGYPSASHMCALHEDQIVYCWGNNNSNGQLGNGSTDTSDHAVVVQTTSSATLEHVTDIAIGDNHSCGIAESAEIWCWGNNDNTKLGTNSINFTSQALKTITYDSTLSSLALGNEHSCALSLEGSVRCWGRNSNGTLGNDTRSGAVIEPQAVITESATLTNISSVSLGAEFSCALENNGNVWCWGENVYGELGRGNTDASDDSSHARLADISSVTKIIVGADSICLKQGSSLVCWGSNENGVIGLPYELPDRVSATGTPTVLPDFSFLF